MFLLFPTHLYQKILLPQISVSIKRENQKKKFLRAKTKMSQRKKQI